MDYINLKFKIALTKNKVDIKHDNFVSESDILEIYEKLISWKQLTVKKTDKATAQASKENKSMQHKNTGFKTNRKMGLSEFAFGLENFVDVLTDKCDK